MTAYRGDAMATDAAGAQREMLAYAKRRRFSRFSLFFAIAYAMPRHFSLHAACRDDYAFHDAASDFTADGLRAYSLSQGCRAMMRYGDIAEHCRDGLTWLPLIADTRALLSTFMPPRPALYCDAAGRR